MDSKKRYGFHDPLNPLDTETQTDGCRATNPDICANNGIQNVCAFASNDSICKRPSVAWKKQYRKLKENGNGKNENA